MARRRSKEEDEVEQMLQAAQDEMILKLSIGSHTSRSSNDYLDPDLHSRFLALKSQPPKNNQRRRKNPPPPPPESRSPTKSKDVEESPDDLMLRFAALKTSLPSPSSVSTSLPLHDEDADEDDEVEKLIQWAIDAARLDPSPPSDEDHDQSSDNDDDDNGSTTDLKP